MKLQVLLFSLAVSAVGLVATSVRAQPVTVYTAATSSVVDELTGRFQRETGIKVEVVKAGSGDLVRRVRAESASPKADVLWSIGAEQLESNKDLLTEFTPTEASSLVPDYKLSQSWAPYSGIVVVFSVNTNALKPSDYPKTWKDLSDPRWKGKISSARADSSGSGFPGIRHRADDLWAARSRALQKHPR